MDFNHRMATNATKFSSKSAGHGVWNKKLKNGHLGSKATAQMQLRTLGMCSMTKLSLNTSLNFRISKIFKSDVFVSFEINVKGI